MFVSRSYSTHAPGHTLNNPDSKQFWECLFKIKRPEAERKANVRSVSAVKEFPAKDCFVPCLLIQVEQRIQ